MTHEIVLGGFGGQGVKVIATLLAQAAHHDGKQAMMYNIYAAAIRGGPIYCTVRVSNEAILGGPTTTTPTAVLAMDPNTVQVYEDTLQPGGTLVVNSTLVADAPRREDINMSEGTVTIRPQPVLAKGAAVLCEQEGGSAS